MSRKNFKVDTAQKGQTAKTTDKHPFVYKKLNTVEKSNVPTGKVTTLEDKKKRREEREKQYRDFRIAALKRRAARMKLTEEETQQAVEKLIAQLDAPKQYTILVMYDKSIRDKDGNRVPLKPMVEEIIKNSDLKYLMKGDSHMYFEGNAAMLASIRELMPPGVDIHPYAKKMPPVIPAKDPPKVTKTIHSKAAKKAAAAKAKANRKASNIKAFLNRKKGHGKAAAKVVKMQKLKKKSNQLKKAA